MAGIRIGGKATAVPEVVPIIGTFFSGGNQHYVGVLTVDPGEDPTQITTPSLLAVENPYLSPNKQKLAWVMPNSGGGPDDGIWVSNPDGSDATQILGPSHPDWIWPPEYVAWSPDSTTLVFNPTGEEVIQSIPAAGGSVTTLYTDGSGRQTANPAYNFDGTKIAFTVLLSSTSFGIWVMDADGSSPAQIETSPTQFSGLAFEMPPFAWQRAASKLAWNDNTLASPVWKLMDDDGTNQVTLVSLSSGAGYPCWQAWLPDDSALLVRGQHVSGGATDEVYAADAAGGGTTLFHDFGTALTTGNLFVYFGRLYVDASNDILSVLLDGTDQRNEGSGTTDNLGLTA